MLGVTIAMILSGCAGYVSGDLKDTPQMSLDSCEKTPSEYEVTYNGTAKEYEDDIAESISGWTLGIVPTYWTNTEESEVIISRNGEILATYKYKSRIHKFYGILWLLILNNDSINSIQSDEGGGIRVKWGIKYRSIYKAITTHGLGKDKYCIKTEN